MENKLTDNEIIKAFECCKENRLDKCLECPAGKVYEYCSQKIFDDALDLINRQNAEIERLTLQNNLMTCERALHKIGASDLVLQHRTEAIKEFAKTYKDHIKDFVGMFTDEGFYVSLDAVLNAVDFICERMVGER